MPVTPTALTVTPSWSGKRLTIVGDASVRETVALTLVDCADDTSIVFKISSEDGRVNYAKFPAGTGDEWTVDGNNLTASLSLNTDLMVAAFSGLGADDRLPLLVTVASATNSNLYAKGCKQFGNWIESTTDPVAYTTPLAARVATLEDSLDSLEGAFAAHTHNGSDSPQLAHSGLSGIGVNSHAAIDSALNDYSAAVATVQQNIDEVTARVETLEEGAETALAEEDFAGVSLCPSSGNTVKSLVAKINELIGILKG